MPNSKKIAGYAPKTLWLLTALIIFAPIAVRAQTATIQQTPVTTVTMNEPVAVIPFLITNTGATGNITDLTLAFDAGVYNISPSTMAPAGWQLDPSNAGMGQSNVRFFTAGAGIPPGGSLTFNVIVVGLTGLNITQDAADMTDALSGGNKTKIVGFTIAGGLPTWRRLGLDTSLTASPPSVNVGETIAVVQTVFNRSTVAQTIPMPATPTASPGGLVTFASSSGAAANVPVGGAAYFTYYFVAAAQGNVSFSGVAANSTGTTTAARDSSNSVKIGLLTTTVLNVSPSRVVTGQSVTVTMTVTNNGKGLVRNVVPIANLDTTGSTATLNLTAGPTPGARGWLGPGDSATFSYTYQVTGSLNQTFVFTGFANSNQGPSATTTSNTGIVGAYTVVISPVNAASCSTNITYTVLVYNGGGTNVTEIAITNPANNAQFALGSSNSATFGAGKATGNPANIVFSRAGSNLASGATDTITLTYTSIPCVAANTDYSFAVTIATATVSTTIEAVVTVTAYNMTLTAVPSSGIPANGADGSDITATVTNSGLPKANIPVVFTTTEGTILNAVVVTNASGISVTRLLAPVSAVNETALVRAEANGVVRFITVTFVGLGLMPNPLYLPPTLTPTLLVPDQNASFTLEVSNEGVLPVSLTTASTFSFTDGVRTYTANLVAPVTIAGGGASAVLVFNPATVPSGFTIGSYFPRLTLVDANGVDTFIRPVSDAVTIVSGPNLLLLKSYTVTGGGSTGNGTTTGAANPGATLTYTVQYQNTGATNALNTVLRDSIPANTDYVPNSITLNGAAKTDAADGDECSIAGGVISCAPGNVAVGGSGTLRFQVTVK